MKAALALSLLFSLPLTSHADPVCPINPREGHLSLHQVMRNFGSYTLNADSLATGQRLPASTVSDAEISAAIADLEVVRACASDVLTDTSGHLLPDNADFEAGPKRDKLIADFHQFMREFREGMAIYEQDFKDILQTPRDRRSFAVIAKQNEVLNDLINRAHGAVGTNANN